MEFRNLTPFPALAFQAKDPLDEEHHVVVMRVSYALQRGSDGTYALSVEDDAPPALCMADEYFGETGSSSVRQESDLAPYKPRCDVIVNAQAVAPAAIATPAIKVGIRIERPPHPRRLPEEPNGLNPMQRASPEALRAWRAAIEHARSHPEPGEVLLDKTLIAHGPRRLLRRPWPARALITALRWASLGQIDLSAWRLTRAEPIAFLPLRYEYAYGGESRVDAGDPAAWRVPRSAWLSAAQCAEHPGREAPAAQQALAHEACAENPLGLGFATDWLLRALAPEALDAPRIEYPDEPFSAALFWRIARGKADLAVQPAGLGCVGRAWSPRLARAGTYDETWLTQKHPGLPDDFDFGYWNCAPEDQQIPFLQGTETIELTGMSADGTIRVTLPGHRPFLLVRYESGVMLPLPLLTDTLIIDLEVDPPTLTLVHRASLRQGQDPAARPRVIEARFETDPEAPLIRVAPSDPAQQERTEA